MNRVSIRSIVGVAVSAVSLASAGCRASTEPSATENAVLSPLSSRSAPTAGPAVSSVNPSYGHDGDVTKQVTITGSGFAPGAQAAWERNGVIDPKIQISTAYVSSTQVIATISIAADATEGFYDVTVTNADRKKGIGYSLFEVTQATQISGTEIAYDTNSNGEIVGRVGPAGAFYFTTAAGLDILGGYGRAYAITEDGKSVVGGNTINSLLAKAYVFQNIAGTWQETILPKDPAACLSRALAVGSNLNGSVAFIGGIESTNCGQNNLHEQPRVWTFNGSGWDKNILPSTTSTDNTLDDVNGRGLAVGTDNKKAAVWTPNGLGGWTLTAVGATGSALHGIRNDGTIAAGETNGAAGYWTYNGASWSGPFTLPGGCSSALSVDDAGEILANGCVNGNRRTPAVIAPPYGSGSVRLLGGLGDNRGTITGQRISANGAFVAGQAVVSGVNYGVFWKLH